MATQQSIFYVKRKNMKRKIWREWRGKGRRSWERLREREMREKDRASKSERKRKIGSEGGWEVHSGEKWKRELERRRGETAQSWGFGCVRLTDWNNSLFPMWREKNEEKIGGEKGTVKKERREKEGVRLRERETEKGDGRRKERWRDGNTTAYFLCEEKNEKKRKM